MSLESLVKEAREREELGLTGPEFALHYPPVSPQQFAGMRLIDQLRALPQKHNRYDLIQNMKKPVTKQDLCRITGFSYDYVCKTVDIIGVPVGEVTVVTDRAVVRRKLYVTRESASSYPCSPG